MNKHRFLATKRFFNIAFVDNLTTKLFKRKKKWMRLKILLSTKFSLSSIFQKGGKNV
jgi:hypothetical protein